MSGASGLPCNAESEEFFAAKNAEMEKVVREVEDDDEDDDADVPGISTRIQRQRLNRMTQMISQETQTLGGDYNSPFVDKLSLRDSGMMKKLTKANIGYLNTQQVSVNDLYSSVHAKNSQDKSN